MVMSIAQPEAAEGLNSTSLSPGLNRGSWVARSSLRSSKDDGEGANSNLRRCDVDIERNDSRVG